MRILVDQAFPHFIEQARTLNLELLRYPHSTITDEDLVSEAAGLDCQGVIFMGVRSLLSVAAQGAAAKLGLALFGTYEQDDPYRATAAVTAHVADIERKAAPGANWVILVREMRALEEILRQS